MANLVCEKCQRNIQKISELEVSRINKERNGVFIATVKTSSMPFGNNCALCQLLASMRMNSLDLTRHLPVQYQISSEIDEADNSAPFELRAFSFLRNYDGIDSTQLRGIRLCDSINIAVVSKRFDAQHYPAALKSLFWRCGHLLYSNKHIWQPNSLSARIVTRRFDPSVVAKWLHYCKDHHVHLCSNSAETPYMIKVIDCDNRTIILAPQNAQYVTLSYVWGRSKDVSSEGEIKGNLNNSGLALPVVLPQVVEDAIEVSLALGYHYLWVDKYCINQRSTEKYDQIRQMDRIYNRSELTIIAVAGEDENTGLPGVGTTPRNAQPVIDLGYIKMISTMPHPHHRIKGSKWMTRGWTLQESILARRRLVFTEDQIYFECSAMNCFEALDIPLDMLHSKRKDHFHAFMRAGLFTGRDEGLENPIFGQPFGPFDDRNQPWSYHFTKYLVLATNYTSRNLSFDSDSLNAFSGIMGQFEMSSYQILQLRGIPYLLPPPFPHSTTHLDCAIAGLCWRHIECCWTGSQAIRRRTEFPSWTWAGWAGTVTWTDLFTAEAMDIKSLVDSFHCEFEDGTTLDMHRYNTQQHASRPRTACALRLSAWRIPPRMISLHGSESAPQWKIAEFVLELHVSYFEGNPSAFLEALKEGQLEFIWVGKGLFNSYFLVVKLHGAFATRIGVGEAIFYSEEGKCHRFAEDARFETLKKDIYLI